MEFHAVDATPQKTPLPSLKRLPIRIAGSDRRVILLPFVHGSKGAICAIFDFLYGLTDEEVAHELDKVMALFLSRHKEIEARIEEHYVLARNIASHSDEPDKNRRLLLGAYFSMEYSIEAAALFNPSIVPNPVQDDVPAGSLRFVMSFRATGEGHVSSAVFQTGVIEVDGTVRFDPMTSHSSRTRLAPDRRYLSWLFRHKLGEMALDMESIDRVLAGLPEEFSLPELEDHIDVVQQEADESPLPKTAVDGMLWLARSNYTVKLSDQAAIPELVLFPHSDNEARGIEDLRLVQFFDDDGEMTYYGTYTAYDGYSILPMLIETKDFRSVHVHTLNGACVQNKGMALFPRRINGHYAMCSRIDGRNLYIMLSDYVHFWESAEILAEPKFAWECRIMGNCGSPIETDEGWLLITHGVGPMRQYSIGAMLLDLDDPFQIRGRLRNPILFPTEDERDGYVPNVVYSCGSLIHQGFLVLPYAMSDKASAIATVEVDELVERLIADGP